MKQLEAHERRVSEVLDSSFEFHIPEYQRPYAWDTTNALQLLDDLQQALERDTDEPYFLGSIVLVKDPATPQAHVIDGQQRLTTLSLLIAVIRDLDVAAEPGLVTALQSRLVEAGDALKGTKASNRLTLRKRDAGFFSTWVQTVGATSTLMTLPNGKLESEAQRNIRDNARALHAALATWEPEMVVELAKMIGQRTYLVVVSTPDLASAHRIFSVMNSRGLDLSPADIIKAQIIGDVSEDLREEYADRWEAAEQEIGRSEFSELFLHLRTIHRKERAKFGLLAEYEAHILPAFVGKETEFVDDFLVPYADTYEELLHPTTSNDPTEKAITLVLRQLHQLDDDDWRPPALWAMRHLGNDRTSLLAVLRGIERLAASMHIRREYTTPRAQRYIAVLKELDAGGGAGAPSLDLTTLEKQQTLRALDGDVYSQRRARRYILVRLDEELAKASGVTYDHSVLTIEHVLPQTPSEDSEWTVLFTEADRELWTNRLANLVLLNRRKNSAAQNSDFATKKAKYFTTTAGVTNFALTSQVLQCHEWTPALLAQRQSALLTVLSTMWELGQHSGA